MNKHNFEVIAEFKDDLSQEERSLVEKKIEKLMNSWDMMKINENIFIKNNEQGYSKDFGSVICFYQSLTHLSKYFNKLRYKDLLKGEINVAR